MEHSQTPDGAVHCPDESTNMTRPHPTLKKDLNKILTPSLNPI